MYLLDTNILSETRKIRTGKANQSVIDWLADTPEHLLYVNAVVLMEVERGILAKERKDPQQGEVLRQWFVHVVKPTFAERTFVVDENTARICAKLHIPDHTPENDAWVAASAIQHNLVLVTRNTDDFARTGVRLLNPFQE